MKISDEFLILYCSTFPNPLNQLFEPFKIEQVKTKELKKTRMKLYFVLIVTVISTKYFHVDQNEVRDPRASHWLLTGIF